jgi:hypothetical protein
MKLICSCIVLGLSWFCTNFRALANEFDMNLIHKLASAVAVDSVRAMARTMVRSIAKAVAITMARSMELWLEP